MHTKSSRIAVIIVLASCCFIAGCISIQKSPPVTVRCEVSRASEIVTQWVSRTYKAQATLWQDGVVYRHVPETGNTIRIELEWNAPDLHYRKPFAIIRISQGGAGEAILTVEEEKNDMPMTHQYQNIAAKVRDALVQAGLEVK